MDFEFATARHIVFGRGRLDQLGELVAGYGDRALLVAGEHLRHSESLQRVEYLLQKRGVAAERVFTTGEPEVAAVDETAARARVLGSKVIVGIGGGSVLDVAKAASGLATNGGSVRDYLEGVGTGRALQRPALPLIAVPTTAGTGSEVTRNAVISSREEGFKKSIRSPLLLPAVALVDPALTDSVPPAQTAASGLDALTQLIEPYVSLRAQPATDAMALEGMRRAAPALPRAFEDGSNKEARDEMALASLLGGLCLANAGLGAVHGIAAALGARFGIAHGVACAAVLWQTMEANVKALEARDASSRALERYATIGATLTGRRFERAADARAAAIAEVKALVARLKIPRLGELGLARSSLPAVVKESRGSSMKSNPVVLTDAEIESILVAAL
ncbi:MAG: iron-containing alcohol dehydrogenase [Myxococcales bacterium]|jgi:alcohol dehydrogenase class IV